MRISLFTDGLVEWVTGVSQVAVRFVLGGLFLVGGVAKLRRRDEFAAAVRGYEIGSPTQRQMVALALPWLEAAAGLCLLLGLATSAVAVVVATLLLVFAAAAAINLRRGRLIDCGCFSTVVPNTITWQLVGRDVALALLAVLYAADGPRTLGVEATVYGSTAGLGVGLAGMVVGGSVLVCLAEFSATRRVVRAAERLDS